MMASSYICKITLSIFGSKVRPEASRPIRMDSGATSGVASALAARYKAIAAPNEAGPVWIYAPTILLALMHPAMAAVFGGAPRLGGLACGMQHVKAQPEFCSGLPVRGIAGVVLPSNPGQGEPDLAEQ